MKNKFLIILLTVCFMLSTSTPVSAENGINLSDLSTGQLITLREQLASEFATRGIDESKILPLGSYVAGRDIASGNYILHIFSEGSCSVYVVVLKEGVDPAVLLGSYSEENFAKMATYPVQVQESGEVRISLEEKQVLCVIADQGYGFSGIVTIEKSSGLFME